MSRSPDPHGPPVPHPTREQRVGHAASGEALPASEILSCFPEVAFVYETLDGEAAWQIVGSTPDVTRAAQDMALDPNALRPADLEDETVLAHPSPFCRDAVTFLGILALLNQRGVPVRLYRSLARRDSLDPYLVRVFPKPGTETQAALQAFHPTIARHVSDLQERITWVFDHLAQSMLDGRNERGSGDALVILPPHQSE